MSSAIPLTVTTMRWPQARLHNWSLAGVAAGPRRQFDKAMLVTLLRAPLGLVGAVLILVDQPILAIAALALFAAVDLADGILARSVGQETGVRRLTDVAIDRVTIHVVVLTIAPTISGGHVLFALFLLRDLSQAVVSGYFLVRHRTVLVGPHTHMAYGLAMLAWVTVALTSPDSLDVATILTVLVSLLVLGDFLRRCRALVPEGDGRGLDRRRG